MKRVIKRFYAGYTGRACEDCRINACRRFVEGLGYKLAGPGGRWSRDGRRFCAIIDDMENAIAREREEAHDYE